MLQAGAGNYTIGVLAALLAALLFALTNVIYKKFDRDISVLEIIATRMWIGFPLAAILILPPFNGDGISVSPENILMLTFSMVIGAFLGDGCYFASQARIGVSRAYPIVMSYPLAVYALAALFLSEPVLVPRISGAILIIIGITLITRDTQVDDGGIEESSAGTLLGGFILACFTILFWTLSDLTLQVGLVDVDPLDANFVRFTTGSLLLLPAAPFLGRNEAGLGNRKVLTLILITGILGFGVPIILMTYSVSYVGATVMAIIMASSPLFGTPLSIIYLKEKVTRLVGVGTLLIFVGIILVVIVA